MSRGILFLLAFGVLFSGRAVAQFPSLSFLNEPTIITVRADGEKDDKGDKGDKGDKNGKGGRKPDVPDDKEGKPGEKSKDSMSTPAPITSDKVPPPIPHYHPFPPPSPPILDPRSGSWQQVAQTPYPNLDTWGSSSGSLPPPSGTSGEILPRPKQEMDKNMKEKQMSLPPLDAVHQSPAQPVKTSTSGFRFWR